jgi:hypothetical protein
MNQNFVEKRKFYRLPFSESLLITDGKKTVCGSALNISRGGLFLKTLEPLSLDSVGHIMFLIPGQNKSISLKAKVAHLVFDKQRAEVDCGMGIQFISVDNQHQKIIDDFLDAEKNAYLSLEKVLAERRPNTADIERHLQQLSYLRGLDLSSLRYKVRRICTIFDDNQNEMVSRAGGV